MHREHKLHREPGVDFQSKPVLAEPKMGEKFSDALKAIPNLKNVNSQEEFILADGGHITSLLDLQDKLFSMSADCFNHHVTNDRNDFATWVYHAIQDHELAETLGPLKTRAQNLKAVKERIRELAEQKLTIKKSRKRVSA